MHNAEAVTERDSARRKNSTVLLHKEFTFPGNLESVADSREQVMQFVREYCNDESHQIDIMLALQEALANAASHGCGDDASKAVQCVLEIEPLKISCVMRDPGPGFNFDQVADPDRFDTTTLEHGRGIALMRSLVDEVRFEAGGSEVHFFKAVNCRPITR